MSLAEMASARPHPASLISLVVLVETGWAFNSIACKYGLMRLSPLALVSFRFVLAGVIALPVVQIAWRGARPNRADLGTFVALGLLGVVINQGGFTVGLAYTTVGHSAMIVATGPIFVLLFARLRRLEAVTLAKLIGLALSFSGTAVLLTEYGLNWHSKTLKGDLLTLAGTIGFATYTVFGKQLTEKYDALRMVGSNHIVAALVALPLAFSEGLRLDWAGVTWRGWLPLLYMAGVSSIACYVIHYWALHHLEASRLAAFSYLVPFLAVLFGVTLLGEALTARFLAGGALILSGVYVAQRGARRGELTAESEVAGSNL
jgi:drug/metabolite transporter (DMT)-like permease